MKYTLYTDKLLKKEIEDKAKTETELNIKFSFGMVKENQAECVAAFDNFWSSEKNVSVEFSVEQLLEDNIKNDTITLKDLYLHFKEHAENISFEMVRDSYGGERLICKSKNTPLAFALNQKQLLQDMENCFCSLSSSLKYLNNVYFNEEIELNKQKIISHSLLQNDSIYNVSFEVDDEGNIVCNILASGKQISLPDLGLRYVVSEGKEW